MSLVYEWAAKTAPRPLRWVLPAMVAVALGGCGADTLSSMKLYPVKGKVLLEDGKPLSGCRIVFVANKSSVSMPAATRERRHIQPHE